MDAVKLTAVLRVRGMMAAMCRLFLSLCVLSHSLQGFAGIFFTHVIWLL